MNFELILEIVTGILFLAYALPRVQAAFIEQEAMKELIRNRYKIANTDSIFDLYARLDKLERQVLPDEGCPVSLPPRAIGI